MHLYLFKNATAMKIASVWMHIHGCKPTEDETENHVILMGTVFWDICRFGVTSLVADHSYG